MRVALMVSKKGLGLHVELSHSLGLVAFGAKRIEETKENEGTNTLKVTEIIFRTMKRERWYNLETRRDDSLQCFSRRQDKRNKRVAARIKTYTGHIHTIMTFRDTFKQLFLDRVLMERKHFEVMAEFYC